MAWILLFAAGALETVWAVALKKSDGLSELAPTVLFTVALVGSMALLAMALRTLDLGVGYAVWTGTGAVGAAIAGVALFGDPATLSRLAPIGLIAVGIVWLAVGD